MTPSKSAFSEILVRLTTDSIHQEIPGLSGTAIGDGLLLALDALSGSTREKTVILVTDGEANVGIDPKPVAKYLAENRIKIFSVGIGDPKGIDLFVTDKATGQKQYFIGNDGRPIRAIVDEGLLKDLSAITGGDYGLAKDALAIGHVFERIDQLTKTEMRVKEERRFSDASAPFALILCLSFLSFSFLRPKGAENQPA